MWSRRRNRKYVAAILAVTLAFAMTGCGENVIPDMTKEEVQAVGEYAAITLMKYDASNRSRLVELPEDVKPDADTPKPPDSGQEPSGMRPVDDTPVVDGPGKDTEESDDLNVALGLAQGVTITYRGETVCDRYPTDQEAGFAVPAAKGKRLLVLHFLLVNDTGEEQTVNLAAQKFTLRMTVNEEVSKQVLPAVLPNDLAALAEVIPAGGSAEAVILTEIDENLAADVRSISLKLKNEEDAYTIRVK